MPFFSDIFELEEVVVLVSDFLLAQEASMATPTSATTEVRMDFFIGC